jgi:uncharacterized protein (TIGR02996 family)
MSDREALLAAILANPDEDTPRLMFADWLDEHGQPERAEFIRVQIELARLRAAEADLPTDFGRLRSNGMPPYWNRPHDTPERISLLKREAELHASHCKEWITGLPKCATNPLDHIRIFRRGFVGQVTVSLGPLLRDPAALWEHHPIESLHLFWAEAKARRKIPACRPLERLRELSLEPNAVVPGDADLLTPYAQCPYLANLHTLDVFQMNLEDSGAEVLAASEFLRPTKVLLSCSGLGPTGLARLLASPFASRLRHLEPSGLGNWGVPVIAEAPLDHLRYLTLYDCGCGTAGITALTRSRHLTQLVTLDLRLARFKDAAVEVLAGWPGLASVRALDLSQHMQVTGRGVEALVRSPYFRPEHLELEDTGVGDDGARALAGWPGLANLVTLDLSYTQMHDAGGLALADSPYGQKLRHLKLSGSTLTGGTIARLRARFGTALDIEG